VAERPPVVPDVERALEVLRSRFDPRTAAFLNSCVRCGLCADTCHVFLADGEAASAPAHKVERLGRLFRRYHTVLGRLAPSFVGARDVDGETLEALAAAAFGRCTLCGRCALNCSVGLDPAAIIRFARTVLVAAGMVPRGIRANADLAIATGNNMGISREDVLETVAWLEQDLRDTLGDDTVEMPVDRAGARVLYALNPREVKFFPLSLSAAAAIFHVGKESWTLTSTDFDITNYGYFAADADAARAIAGRLAARAEELGVDFVVAELLAHQLLGRLEIAEAALQRGEVFEAALVSAVLSRHLLRRLLVVPEVGGAHALLEGGDLPGQARGVKDSSAASSGVRNTP